VLPCNPLWTLNCNTYHDYCSFWNLVTTEFQPFWSLSGDSTNWWIQAQGLHEDLSGWLLFIWKKQWIRHGGLQKLTYLFKIMQLFKVFGGNRFPFVQHFRYFSKHPTHAYTTECEPGQATYKPSTIQNSVCKRLEDCRYISTWILYSQHKMVASPHISVHFK